MTGTQQLAWDFDLAEVATYTGRAPLHFTAEAFTLDEYRDAFEEWKRIHGSFGCFGRSHMWHLGFKGTMTATPGHNMQILDADLDWTRPTRVACECGWLSDIHERESPCVEEWHDHAWPGWRGLPVVPEEVRPAGGGVGADKKATQWVTDRYPTDFQKPGAPVITMRNGIGTRHVPGYSPWGGFDLCAESVGMAA